MKLFNIYFKQNAQFTFSLVVGALMYLAMIIYIYPTIADMGYIDEMIKKMPKELIAIFNIDAGLSNINSFVAMEYYGMIFIILMFCFSLILANNVYGKWISNQSMSTLLNTPNSRTKLMTVIQMFIVIMHLILGGAMAAGGMGLIEWFVKNPDYSKVDFMNLNLIGVFLFLVFSLFAITCMLLMPTVKSGMTVAIVVSFMMYALSIVSKISKDTKWLENITLFTLNDSSKISTGDADLLLSYGVYIGIIVVLFILNIVLFRRKNLYL